MLIYSNGKPIQVEEGLLLESYLEGENYTLGHIAVELNGQIVPKASFKVTSLQDGDKLEIVRFVGGG